MKKLILLFLSSICLITGSAQITLTTTDIAGPQKVIYKATDTMVASSMIGFAGASQSWNMTSLTPDQMDTMTFLPYSYWPNSNFSGANLLIKTGYTNTLVYLSNTTGVLSILGIGIYPSGTPTIYKDTPAEVILNFPATFNSTFTNNYVTKATNYFGIDPGVGFVIDSLRTRSYVKKNVLADAWGNLSTPYPGGPYSVLRIKETKITHDTTDAFFSGAWTNGIDSDADSVTTYNWWAKNIGFPLATATMDSLGNVSTMEWLKTSGIVGITESSIAPEVNLYPNPAKNEINITTDATVVSLIRVYDITGRMMNEYPVKNGYVKINTTAFTDGVYTYSLIGKNAVILKQGKFTVSK